MYKHCLIKLVGCLVLLGLLPFVHEHALILSFLPTIITSQLRAPPCPPPSIVAACQGQIHTFDSQDLIDVYIPDGPETVLYHCEQQPCPNQTPQSIEQDYPRYKAIRRAQHSLGPHSTLTSRSASRHSCPVSPSSHLPQTVAGPSQARGDLPPDPAPEPEPEESASKEGVSEFESADPARPALPTALAPVPTSGGPPQPPLPPCHPLSPPLLIMSSPSTALNKETLKLLLPFCYDGKTIIECDRFLLQLCIYWLVNTSLTTIELKVQVALSLLDGDAQAWATSYFPQLTSVQMGVQGAMTPFRNEATFTATFKARFGNLDDEAAAQVELAKLCADKSVREKCTAAEFSMLFKGPADRSGYGDLELCDKYSLGPADAAALTHRPPGPRRHAAHRPAAHGPTRTACPKSSHVTLGLSLAHHRF
ncbi:predicted protein, partial [Postia placenta Mad-698-R]